MIENENIEQIQKKDIFLENEEFTFGIVGAGKLGMVLASQLDNLNRLQWILAKSDTAFQRTISTFGSSKQIYREIAEVDELPNMTILSVNDSSISKVIDQICDFHSDKIKGKYFIHCSGVMGKEVLQPIKDLGGIVAAVHPFQTFIAPKADVLKDIRWGVDADDECYDTFANFVTFLYGFPIRVMNESHKDRALYHAVAVAASNYMTTIIQLANKIADSANIDSNEFLPPIAKTTLGNNLRGLSDKEMPLTGPVSRGDLETIDLHIQAMVGNTEILEPYCLMGLATAKMAYNSGLISELQFKAMKSLFLQHISLNAD
jgi:predicted short-subunit dehydrogenase-like oxidoreductase (DUF2520 family)